MKLDKNLLVSLLPIGLAALILVNLKAMVTSKTDRPAPYRTELDSLKLLAARAELAAKNRPRTEPQVDATPIFTESAPVVPVVRQPVAMTPTPADTFQREQLSVQGIMKSGTPLAVMIDSKGNSHFVKVGESLYNRKVTGISSSGVILVDPKGTEIVQIP